MNEPALTLHTVDEPYDEHESFLVARIRKLQLEYERAAKPYLDALVRSRSLKIPQRYLVANSDAAQLLRDGLLTGTTVPVGGKRIDPLSIYKEPPCSN